MISQVEIVVRLLVAAALGSVIGFERERLSWSAGLRTHMLVCVGSALIMLVSAFGFSDILNTDHVVLDPSRMAAQVVSGIGFLGAGSILLRGEVIRGLTTAASLWTVAAVGLAAGAGMYIAAVATTIIVLIILAGIKPLERRYFAVRQRRGLRLVVDRGRMNVHVLEEALGAGSARVKQFIVQQAEDSSDTEEVQIVLSRVTLNEFQTIVKQLGEIDGVKTVSESGV
jgi:putative Mg2+ transporter-C (MgtC) family protein